MQKRYTEQQLKNAINQSRSIRETLIKLNIGPAGGNYYTIKKYIKQYNIDTSHFMGKSWLKNRIIGPKRDINEYLSNKVPISSHSLKNRLITENIFKHICQNCQRSKWLGKPIPIELHHIDGNHFNNNIDNLQILCPNCHACTNNHKGKNIKTAPKTINACIKCNNPCKNKYCSIKCSNRNKYHKTKIQWPQISELHKLTSEIGYSATGRKLGVSDNAIRKYIKNHSTI